MITAAEADYLRFNRVVGASTFKRPMVLINYGDPTLDKPIRVTERPRGVRIECMWWSKNGELYSRTLRPWRCTVAGYLKDPVPFLYNGWERTYLVYAQSQEAAYYALKHADRSLIDQLDYNEVRVWLEWTGPKLEVISREV